MKKKIGISYSRTNFSYYWEWFAPEESANTLDRVKLSFEENNLADIKNCDGFIITGGVDINPDLYNGARDYDGKPTDGFQPDRDSFEKKIFEYAQENKLPVFGICRGFQLVNVLLGGKLIQDLGIPGNKIHCKVEQDKQHEVIVEKNTLLHDITGVDHGKVNSAHHQAIDKLGNGLAVNARSADGVIEGFEWADHPDKPFLLCVQWHPERMFRMQLENSPLSKNIKERFIEELLK
ncbi:MAG: gamma-glutamyl-gamma-aminobutyrate hydrolase family protein [Bacteroidetes bacterium]|nr:gamma-glutamyl-gamma-aminobutyrate hydrolase family protein [Bacteroidota bacterium]